VFAHHPVLEEDWLDELAEETMVLSYLDVLSKASTKNCSGMLAPQICGAKAPKHACLQHAPLHAKLLGEDRLLLCQA